MKVGLFWASLAAVSIAAGIAATKDKDSPRGFAPAYSQCASQPNDGGQCLMHRADGGVVKFGKGTQFNADNAFGECEIKPCALSP